jgi:hypothetical protein
MNLSRIIDLFDSQTNPQGDGLFIYGRRQHELLEPQVHGRNEVIDKGITEPMNMDIKLRPNQLFF